MGMKIFVVAGEKSGDKQGALLMREMQRQRPGIVFAGLGGAQMHRLAPDTVEDWAEHAAVIGVMEVLRHLRYFLRRLRETEERIAAEHPEALLLIDYPGFNQRLASRVQRRCPSIKIIWFIAPMVWAWHRGRIPKLAATLDLMLCTFPFEQPLFEAAGLRTRFVGHPLADEILATKGIGERDQTLIGLFPGSRTREVERHFPVFLRVAAQIRAKHPEWHIETSASSPKLYDMMQRTAERAGVGAGYINIRLGNYHSLMERAQAALVTSGTATLEAALHGLPFALVYKVAWGTYILARMLLSIRFIGMVNILADAPVTRELIQGDFTPENCVAELEHLMLPEHRQQVLREMHNAVACLSQHGGAAACAANEILRILP